jgi:hypothetical protein
MNGGHAGFRKKAGAQNPAYRRASHFISTTHRADSLCAGQVALITTMDQPSQWLDARNIYN